MTVTEIMTRVVGADYLREHPGTVDTLKFGEPDREVRRLGTCFAATPRVLAAAKEWGADLLITHEPTFFTGSDTRMDNDLTRRKLRLLEETGIAVWRYHDSMHRRGTDEVSLDLIERMGWTGDFDGRCGFVLTEPVRAGELLRTLGERLQIRHPRLIGDPALPVTKLRLYVGEQGGYEDFLYDSGDELVIGGETCEWHNGEPIREAAEMGLPKALILLGHCGSERLSMARLADRLDGRFDGAPARYFDCGELYSYPADTE